MNGRASSVDSTRTDDHSERSNLRAATLPPLLLPGIIALVVLAAAGRTGDGLLVALGACTALFGARQPVGRRLATTVGAALLLLLAVGSGQQVADVFLTLILWNLVVAVAATALDVVRPLGATGPWSLVLMVDVGSLLGMNHVGLGTVLRDVGAGCVIGILTGLVDSRLRRRSHPVRDRRVVPGEGVAPRVRRVLARFLEGYIAVLLTSVFPHATHDRHPFWPVLVVVLVVSAPVRRTEALRRALRCLAGALVAVLLYVPLSKVDPPTAVGVVVVIVLALLAAGLLTRHDAAGSLVTALLALLLTRPLLPTLNTGDLLVQHGVDALVAVALSLIMIRLVRPRRAAAR